MNKDTLTKLGLNEAQAKIYLTLIQNGRMVPPKLAEATKESRTNTYTVLERLVELGLVRRIDSDKKLAYEPENPIALEKLMEKRRKEVHLAEQQVKSSMPALLNYFYTYQNRPGIRFFEGQDGIVEMYQDQLRTKQDIYFMRSDGDLNLLGPSIYKFIERRHELGLIVHGIEPAKPKVMKYASENDERLGRDMAWFPPAAYNEPVNIYTYGNKVAIISYAEETMGVLIESPQIAAAFRQLHEIIKVGAETLLLHSRE
jgi:sugar-specific transcriptional regulator TrmB